MIILVQDMRRRYQYKGYWIETFIELDESEEFYYVSYVELPHNEGVIESHLSGSREEAEFAAEELINSWN